MRGQALTVQAVPLSSKSVHSTKSVAYLCEQVRPNLSSLIISVESPDIYLEVFKLLVEMSSFCGDMEKLERTLRNQNKIGVHASPSRRSRKWGESW